VTSERPVVVWFRRDLRVHDHPALTDAIARGRLVAPLYVLDPALLHGRFASPNRAWFLVECVEALRRELEGRGGRLFVRIGDPVAVVPAFAREVEADEVLVSRDYAPYGRRRDRAVADALRNDGGAFHAKRGLLIHEPEDIHTATGSAFTVFGPFQRRRASIEMRAVLPAPAHMPTVDGDDGAIPDLEELGLGAPTAALDALPAPGEAAARLRLESWLDSGPEHGPASYHLTRDRLADPHATSRLSADLRFGTLSPVEVATRVRAAEPDGDGSRRFLTELAWRDFYAHALWHEPRISREPLDTRYRSLAWQRDDDAFAAWQDGRTGYPIVDAAMRQLRQTGWLPNRARMIVASFLTKDLGIDWRIGERHFMANLIDGDPASNLGGWQWAASIGSDGGPFVRVFNPVTQAKRFDPDGDYVRAWVRELARVDTAHIHEPWTMADGEQVAAGCRIGEDYPSPIVDHAAARRRALERYATAVNG
jgi:deoxyribodipyrimidine photo-lyase